MTRVADPVAAYLAKLPPDQRKALAALRRAILAAAPGAEEGISTRVPAYFLEGRYLASFGAAKEHVSLFVMRGTALTAMRGELGGFEATRNAVRFTPEAPLSETPVRRILAFRIKEIEAAGKGKSWRPSPR